MLLTCSAGPSKIGDNPTSINANSLLELESTNKGLLIPRVALTATNNVAPFSAHTAGMLVYNTATSGTAPNNVTPGFYYNDGSSWTRVVNGPAGTSGNIYTADGTLAGNRTVTQGTDTLSFTGNAVNGFSVDGRTFSVDMFTNKVGIGTNTPAGFFHVNYLPYGGTGLDPNYVGSSIVNSCQSPSMFFEGSTGSSGTRVARLGQRVLSNYTSNGAFVLAAHSDDGSTINIPAILCADLGTGNVGLGTFDPVGKLTNTHKNHLNSLGNGVDSANTLNWVKPVASGRGNVAQFVNESTSPGAGGVSIKTFAFDTNTVAFDVSLGVPGYTQYASSLFTVLTTGKVGVGTQTPGNQLEVKGPTFGTSGLRFTYMNNSSATTATNVSTLGLNSSGDVVNVPNFYTNNGTLSSNRIVLQGNNTLSFGTSASTGTSHFTVDGTTFNVDAVNNRIGIGKAAPTQALDVTGNVRFSGAIMPNNLSGTTGQVLTSAGAGLAPTWTNTSSLPVTVSNTSTSNNLTTTVNGVTGTAVTMVNSVANTVSGNTVNTTVNGVVGTAVTVPNVYTTDGSLSANRTVTQGANTLAFTSTASTGTSHFTVDGNTLNVDAANDRVSIGTNSPLAKLHITQGQGATTNLITAEIHNCGTPCAQGTARNIVLANNNINNLTAFASLDFVAGSTSTAVSAASIIGIDRDVTNNYAGMQFWTRNATDYAARVTIKSTGNVGIGTSSPGGLLSNTAGSTNHLNSIGTGVDFSYTLNWTKPSGSGGGNVAQFVNESTDAFSAGVEIKTLANSSTSAALDVSRGSGVSAGTPLLTVLSTGNVGVGTKTPGNKLELTSGTAGASGLRFSNLNSATAITSSGVATLGVNASGDVVTVPSGDFATQTIQNMTSSRSLGTTFTNSTGRPIMVMYGVLSNAATRTNQTATVNGITAGQCASYNGDRGTGMSFMVPAGATYSISSDPNVLGFFWTEWR